MTQKCYDAGMIQAFLDGELASDVTETVARHVSVCDDCAILMATAEEESAAAYSILEQEFNTLVPTQRLWTKINDSIEKEKKSFWKPIFDFLLQPQAAAFAGLLLVAVVSVGLLTVKQNVPVDLTAQNNAQEQTAIQPILNNKSLTVSPTLPSAPEVKNVPAVDYRPNPSVFRAVKIAYVQREANRTPRNQPIKNADAVNPALTETVLGEASYVKTIATLTETVNNRKDEALDSSSRFAFERDLAVTDDAIKQMRKQVRENPRDEAAKQILRSSYQNKIDLLNSVADKTELMASLR
ncbi:MAG: hypothetical protein LH614_17445 [Pyrinomonadaceae bacterium]|nr:hypothetical protein [Pyrinomonadaceae bacterium]